jgi:methylated-DNA-[protein]-cysteine S-methyltransferase
MHYIETQTPLGLVILATQSDALSGVWFNGQQHFAGIADNWCNAETALLREAEQQLQAYLQGRLTQFNLPLAPQGTSFHQAVWQALQQLAYGETCAYGELAVAMGKPQAVRAVAAAIGKNPLSIIIPCHRVIGSQGQLTGYAGGLDRKQWLLDLEQAKV